MLFLLVVQQLETWKETAALKWDLCLFPVQAAEGQPGPAGPSSPPTAAQAPPVRGAGLVPGGPWGPREGAEGEVLRKERTGVETLPGVEGNPRREPPAP